MTRKFVTSIDLLANELQNAKIHVLASAPGSPAEGQVYYDSTLKAFRFYTGSAWITLGRLDQLVAPTADISLNTHKLTGVVDPTAATDAATKNYVDNTVNGLDWKNPVRLASTANVAIATGLANGQTIDGVTIVTGDRILLKNQTTGAENGIYVAPASGAASRSSDASTAAQVLQLAVAVEEGTANADTFWVNTTNAPITLGTTALTIAQFGAGATYTAGAGLALSTNQFSIENSGVLTVAHGGTGASTAAGARSALSVPGKYAVSVGDNSSTTIVVNHALGTTDVVVMVFRVASPFDVVEPDIQVTDSNNVTLLFASPPSSNQFRCVVIG